MFKGERLSDQNIKKYINNEKYIKKVIKNIDSLIQNDYGGANDCVLVSIACIIYYFYPQLNQQYIYSKIEQLGKKFGHKYNLGTPKNIINKILLNSLKYFNLSYKTKQLYLKNIGFSYQLIKEQISNNLPILLNITRDGRNYYNNHTVNIIGYLETTNKKMLIIYDNYFFDYAYIDYDKLNILSNIIILK